MFPILGSNSKGREQPYLLTTGEAWHLLNPEDIHDIGFMSLGTCGSVVVLNSRRYRFLQVFEGTIQGIEVYGVYLLFSYEPSYGVQVNADDLAAQAQGFHHGSAATHKGIQNDRRLTFFILQLILTVKEIPQLALVLLRGDGFIPFGKGC